VKRAWIAVVIAAVFGACGRSPLWIDVDPDGGPSAGMAGGNGGGASGHAGGTTAGAGGASGSAGGGRDGGIAGTGDARKVLGESCAESTDCVSGHCIGQGVCCDSACDGDCFSCVLLGSVGRCLPAYAGTACGGSPKCSSDEALGVGPALCDGKGSCRPMATLNCAPYKCDPAAAACRVTCASDADCTRDRCINGLCGVPATGASCGQDSECASGFCTDGVCCNTRCGSPCTSCALPGTIGVCWPVSPGASDPHGFCKDEGAASCGMNGRCAGNGTTCQRYPAGTMCSPQSCLGATLKLAGSCSTQGACIASSQSCAPAMCRIDQTGCEATACSDANCPAGYYCVGADVCVAKKAGGALCGSARECLSNVCSGGLDGGPGRCQTLI
jgi:hypothetical protein